MNKRQVLSKIGLFTQISITPDRVDLMFTETDYQKYYLNVAEYIQDMLELVDNYCEENKVIGKIVGVKIGVIRNELLFKYMVNNKAIGKFCIPLKLITKEEYILDSKNSQKFIYIDEENSKHECYPSDHALKQFSKRYCFIHDINFSTDPSSL